MESTICIFVSFLSSLHLSYSLQPSSQPFKIVIALKVARDFLWPITFDNWHCICRSFTRMFKRNLSLYSLYRKYYVKYCIICSINKIYSITVSLTCQIHDYLSWRYWKKSSTNSANLLSTCPSKETFSRLAFFGTRYDGFDDYKK